jgi:hypothetical protein
VATPGLFSLGAAHPVQVEFLGFCGVLAQRSFGRSPRGHIFGRLREGHVLPFFMSEIKTDVIYARAPLMFWPEHEIYDAFMLT